MERLSRALLCGSPLFASPARALDPPWKSAGRYDAVRGEEAVGTYLLGAGNAFLVANAALEVAGRPKLYCQPASLALAAADYVEIFEQSLARFREKSLEKLSEKEAQRLLDSTSDEIVLFYGLRDRFPCPRSEP